MDSSAQFDPKESHFGLHAAAYLSSAGSLSSISNATKLELYGLFKYLTSSHGPETSRPSIFDMSGRAKWDAWSAAASTWVGREEEAEKRYSEIAKSLGWTPGVEMERDTLEIRELTAEELLDEEDVPTAEENDGGGMGNAVSAMGRPDPDFKEGSTIHSYVVSGNLIGLQDFIKANPTSQINAVDEFGFTPLHLACDRGYSDIVEFLLEHGADPRLKDSDGLTPLELSREAERHDVVALFENQQ